ncbi:MAG TPA: YoaK family protein [Polyangiaceae bacterium]|nr:YoaK family protein [Polyangiaceae bacterium]
MFRHQGARRSDRDNRILAGYLAFFGGFVNSAGFILIGSFTSHVTGSVGRFANDLVARQLDAAAAALTLIGAFFAGAFLVTMTIESTFFGRTPRAYGAALATEALLLAVFTLASDLTREAHPRLRDAEAAILCTAMGMQNALVTRLSGAVVRTTHLTGVVTDIGIESARWFRWWRGELSSRLQVKLSFGSNPPERPAGVKLALLVTIAASFTLGAIAGATSGVALHHAAMIIPAVGVGASSAYAFATARAGVESIRPGPNAPS